MRVFQYIDVLHDYDGIGSDIEGISSHLNGLQVSNFIVARVNFSQKESLKLSQVSTQPFDINILHYGGHGFPLEFFLRQKGVKILRFHNVTPIHFFLEYLSSKDIPTFVWNHQKSELELYSLVKYCDYVWCDSNFNYKTLQSLTEVPKEKVFIIPIQKILPEWNDQDTPKKSKTITFIGRLVPNKKIEDLLFVLYFLVQLDPNYSLYLIGKSLKIFDIYNKKISNLIQDLNLEKNIFFYENLKETEKSKLLTTVESFLCMSEHEGFCIPILESLAHNVLLFAYSQEAVVETCKGSGVLFKEKDFFKIANSIDLILQNKNLTYKLLQAQTKSLGYYKNFQFKEIFRNLFL